MDEVVIRVEHLAKRYQLGERAKYRTIRDSFENLAKRLTGRGERKDKSTTDSFWALDDVSFDVRQGEVLGIIGRNGAGKSTLLKILSRITEPTRGKIEIKGRVGSLLEVGTGFHAELTGRENIYLNGAILGMTQREIARKFDEIIAFAETEKFLDTPVKYYSSGMYTRLAFSVAAHLEPEILIVDEVLAVGDIAFQKKCMGRMSDVARAGRTVLFVSHNIGAIRTLCTRAVLLERGKVGLEGSVDRVLERYAGAGGVAEGDWVRQKAAAPDQAIYFQKVSIDGGNGTSSSALDSTASFKIKITLTALRAMEGVQLAVRVVNQEGVAVFTTANSDNAGQFVSLPAGTQMHHVEIPGPLLPPGRYTLVIAVFKPQIEMFDVIDGEVGFTIEDLGSHATVLRDGRLGVVTPLLQWAVQPF